MSNKNLIWFKNKIIEEKDAKVSILSPTSQFGLNVFEGMRAYYNKKEDSLYVFRFQDHVDRLFYSCKVLSIESKYTKEQIWSSLCELLKESNFKNDVSIRLTLFVDGSGGWSSTDKADMFISPLQRPKKDVNTLKGASACISSWERINDNSMPPRVKCGANYVAGRYSHLLAKRSGYDLPILLNNKGSIAEGAGACIFIINDKELITPPLSSSILESITRDTIKSFAASIELNYSEREINRTELYISDEIFLCGSSAEIIPIVSIDNIKIADGNVGIYTKKILQTYTDIASNGSSVSEYKKWLFKA